MASTPAGRSWAPAAMQTRAQTSPYSGQSEACTNETQHHQPLLSSKLAKGRACSHLSYLVGQTSPSTGRRSPYEAHQTVVDHHGPDPVGGKRGCTGGRGRLRRSAKLGCWAGRVHPEG